MGYDFYDDYLDTGEADATAAKAGGSRSRRVGTGRRVFACHNCDIGPGPACFRCRRASQDDIRIMHTPHNRSEYQAARLRSPEIQQVTSLPQDVEDRLRGLFATVAGLDTLDLLAAVHFARGGLRRDLPGVLRAFGTYLRGLTRDPRGRMHRATQFAAWAASVRAVPALHACRSWAAGSSRWAAAARDAGGDE